MTVRTVVTALLPPSCTILPVRTPNRVPVEGRDARSIDVAHRDFHHFTRPTAHARPLFSARLYFRSAAVGSQRKVRLASAGGNRNDRRVAWRARLPPDSHVTGEAEITQHRARTMGRAKWWLSEGERPKRSAGLCRIVVLCGAERGSGTTNLTNPTNERKGARHVKEMSDTDLLPSVGHSPSACWK